MKKMIRILVSVMAVVVLVACGVNNKTNAEQGKSSEEEKVETNVIKESEEKILDVSKIPVGEITEEIVRNYAVTDNNAFLYEINGDEIKITEYIGDDTIVHIPEKIDGKNVTEIASLVFANDSIVRGIYMPTTIKKIDSLFTNSTTIEVIICEGMEEVTNYAFGNCSSLHTVILGEELKRIGDYSFFSCPALQTLFIPSSVNEIGKEAVRTVFYGCTNLTIIGKSGSTIEAYAKEHGINFQAE